MLIVNVTMDHGDSLLPRDLVMFHLLEWKSQVQLSTLISFFSTAMGKKDLENLVGKYRCIDSIHLGILQPEFHVPMYSDFIIFIKLPLNSNYHRTNTKQNLCSTDIRYI